MRKIKVLIFVFVFAILTIFGLSYSQQVKADNVYISQVEVLQVDSWELLPDDSIINYWTLKKSIFGRIWYKDDYRYFMLIVDNLNSVQSLKTSILYLDYIEIGDFTDYVYEDDYYYDTGDLGTNLKSIQNAILDRLYYDEYISYNSNNYSIYTNLNFSYNILWTNNSMQTNYLLDFVDDDDQEHDDDYYSYFGWFNSAYFQLKFILLTEQLNLVEVDNIPDNYYSQTYIDNNYLPRDFVDSNYVSDDVYDALQLQYDSLYEQFELLNNSDINLSLSSLLSSIFFYPVQLVSGLRDVEIFGVNVYFFIMGIAMLTIALPLTLYAIKLSKK